MLTEVLEQEAPKESVDALSNQYGNCVERDLLSCAVAPGLQELRAKTVDTSWMIVSGGDQAQLRRVFAHRKLAYLFDAGIFGSPTPKDEILVRERENRAIGQRALYIGDSRFDHVAASKAGLDFVFAHQWTEFSGWREYVEQNRIAVITDISELWPLTQAVHVRESESMA